MIKNWQDDPTLQLVMKKIGDDYDVLSYLGGGGLARIYKVYYKRLKETRVIKVMDFHYILQRLERSGVTDTVTEFKKIKDRFVNEVKAYNKFSHPGIIKSYQPYQPDFVEYENNRENIQIPYLILEYVEGTSLKAVLKKKAPLKIETVLKISEDVLSILNTIHQEGIIHRDVKPSNIMIRAGTGEAVLIDFGLAKDLEDQESAALTVSGTMMGSPNYMSPEMFMDSKNITKETDIYSFGIILHEMVTANVPFRGSSMEIMHGHLQMPVPEAEVFNKSAFGIKIRKIILKALAKDAKDRYRSAADFLMALKELRTELVKSGDNKEFIDSALQTVLDEIGKEYDLKQYLGGGGYGKVYLVQDKKSKELRALKILDATNIFNQQGYEDQIKRIVRVANTYANIKHPNIAKIFQAGITHGKKDKNEIPYLIISYIKGSTLERMINERKELSLSTIFKISRDILNALDVIHRKGMIHRDIKPSNIMIEDKNGKAILIDFGLEKDAPDKIKLTTTGPTLGAPRYMSPEQCGPKETITPASDIYSFGVVLFEMLTGEVPFQAENPYQVMYAHCSTLVPNIREINPALPEGIEDIIYKAMEKDPGKRYQRAKDFFDDLEKTFEANNKKISVEWPISETQENEAVNTEKRAVKKDDKRKSQINSFFKKNSRKIVLISLGIIGIASILFLFLKILPEVQFRKYIDAANESGNSGQYSKAYKYLEKAQQIKENAELRPLRATITNKQKEAMETDYFRLNQFLDGKAAKQERLEECRKFTDTYREVISPGIDAEVKKNIAQLETGIKEDNAYQNHIAAADGYIAKSDYVKASEELTKAKQISKVETAEINARRVTIAVKKMVKDYDDLQQYLRGSAENQEKLDNCMKFLNKHRNSPTTDETTAIRAETEKFITGLQKDIRTDEQINGNKEYNEIKDSIRLEDYLSFKSKYPASRYLPDLKSKLIKADENLPPEKYWERELKRNRKGYYEKTFYEHNGHRMVYIPGIRIWIDKYEVSWAQFKRFSNIQPQQGPDLYIQGGDTYPAVATYSDAESYCNRYGLRLPTETEWEFVAGKWESDYPWGNESPDVPASNGKWRANFSKLENGKPVDGFKGTAPVDSFADFSSPFDAVNMAGNVWEWVRGEILKGGSYFSSKAEDLKISSTKKGESWDKEGFRCVKDE